MRSRRDILTGCLIGQAVGDALGLPAEKLSRARQQRMFPDLERTFFLPDRRMCSDDTEHMCLTAQALIVSGGDEAWFTRALAKRLRWWVLGLPAGTGLATLKACGRLWLAIPPDRSGVFSAGNGPAMRTPILGVALADHLELMQKLLRRSSRMTHTDPKAEHGAALAALAAAWSAKGDFASDWPKRFLEFYQAQRLASDTELDVLLEKALVSSQSGESVEQFMASLGITYGVTGYMYHTMPAVLHVWFRHPLDYRRAITEIVRAGGDADTTAAILGGIIGTAVGKEGIPREWRNSIWEWPRSLAWIEQLAGRLAETMEIKQANAPASYFWPGLLLRNLFFALNVLLHGFRRLLPPYG